MVLFRTLVHHTSSVLPTGLDTSSPKHILLYNRRPRLRVPEAVAIAPVLSVLSAPAKSVRTGRLQPMR